jgi:hypothetical protein
VARPLAEAGTALQGSCEIHRDKAGWQLRDAEAWATVNGAAYRPGQILATGDSISFGAGETVLLIEVVA